MNSRPAFPAFGGAAFVLAITLAGPALAAKPVGAADLDRDGRLSLGEYKQASNKMVAVADANKDGTLTRLELDRLVKGIPMPARATAWVERIWTVQDSNADNVLTPREMSDYQERQFQRTDTDHDGFVSRAELDAARERDRRN